VVLLDTLDAEIRSVERRTIAAILAHEPGIREADIERKLIPAASLAKDHNDGQTRGCVIGVVSWLSRSGSLVVIGLCVAWDDAHVYRHRFPWEQENVPPP
jgi:hypothetical protein